MDRRTVLSLAVPICIIPGCSTLTPDESNDSEDPPHTDSSPDGRSEESTDTDTSGEIGIQPNHRRQLREHGKGEKEIDSFESNLTSNEVDYHQQQINTIVEDRIEQLDNTRASIEEAEMEMAISNGSVVSQFRFYSVTLNNTRYIPERSEGELSLLTISEDSINEDGVAVVEVNSFMAPAGEERTYRMIPETESKHTSEFEFTVSYPEPNFDLHIVEYSISENEYTANQLEDVTVEVVNNGSYPGVDLRLQGEIGSMPIIESIDTMLEEGDSTQITLSAFAEPGDTISIQLTSSLGQTLDSLSTEIPAQ